jgi:hypothetical protein
MTVHEHLSTFHGLPVAAFEHGTAPTGPVAWRLEVDTYDAEEPFETVWQRFLATVDTESLTALVIGAWGEVYEESNSGRHIVDLLVAAKDRFPALTGLFFADIIGEEAEISWIQQGNITPLLREFPKLTEFGVRGGTALELDPLRHEALRTLRIETGGLSASVLRALAESELPALRELRLWLGVEEYGADWELSDLAPFLDGKKFSALRHLGLQNSTQQNDIARLVAEADVVPQLETLDLSMGVLTDDGAEALLTGQSLTHLKTLDLHHHYLSDKVMTQLREALEPAGVQVVLDARKEPYVYNDEPHYYTAIAE